LTAGTSDRVTGWYGDHGLGAARAARAESPSNKDKHRFFFVGTLRTQVHSMGRAHCNWRATLERPVTALQVLDSAAYLECECGHAPDDVVHPALRC